MSTTKSDLVSRKKQDQFVSDDSGNFTASVFTDGDGSHVTMLSPRMDPASSVAGMTEDGCFTSAVSLSEYLTAPSTPRNTLEPGDSYLKAIFDNFNELYQDKMSWIDENIPGGDTPAHVMAKKNVLEHWVKDVIEQNNILVQTVEELEVEAEKKVQNLQKKVFEAAELAKEHMGMIKEYEEQIKHLMKEKHIVEKQEEFFRKESVYLEKEKRRALDRLHTLENDNSSLVTLINRIRDMGVWDVNGLNFCPRTYDTIFGLYPNLPGSEVQTVFTQEKAKNLEKAENNIAQLRAQVEELHGRKDEAERLLTEKTKVTEELQNDIKDLHIKIKHYQDEHQDFKRSLKETQDQLRAATMKNQSRPSTADTKRESEMKEMLSELRDLRNQLNIACTERQQAMKESNALKMELRGRITQMEDMKLLLEQLQTDAASTRNAVQDVQDKQDQMSSLKEKVTFYQTSYENSNVLLEAKSEIIVKLQNQMDQLHDKVSKLEQTRSCSQSVPAAANVPVHNPSPTPSLSRNGYQHASRPTSHPTSRAASHLSSHGAPQGQLGSGKKLKTRDVVKKAAVKVKKGSITPKGSKTETKTLETNKKYNSSNKLPWNDHFVRNAKKSTSPRANNSDKLKTTTVASLKYSTMENKQTPTAVTKPSNKTESTCVSRIVNYDAEKSEEKRIFSDASKKQGMSTSNDGSQPVNRIIADYLNQSDVSGKLSSNTDKTHSKQRPMERVKLPPIPTKTENSSPQVSPSKAYDKTVDEHLPRIIAKEKKAHMASNIETLETLMEVCVKASRELNRQSDMEGKSPPKYRVVTGHSHRRHNHKSRENTYTVEAIPKNKSTTKTENVVTKAVFITRNEDTKNLNKGKASNKQTKPVESESETVSDISQFRRVQPHPKVTTPTLPCERSPESILADLPKESQDYLVKKWIVSSPSPSKTLRKPRSTSPNRSSLYNYSDKLDPDSRGKSKSSGPVNLKMLAMDDWIRKQDLTHSDATGDRDSGHLSDFSDCWNWNGNDDDTVDKDIQQHSEIAVSVSGMTTFDAGDSPHQDLDRLQQLILENQRLTDENLKLEQLRESFKQHRDADEEAHKKELELKDVEITMQKGLVHQDEEMVALEQKIRLHCSKFQNKVVDASKELTNLRNLTLNQHTISNSLEKDYLLRRSYTLFQQLEQEQRDYIGDCPENLMGENELGDVELKHVFLNDLKMVKTSISQLNAQVLDKISQIDCFKEENQQIMKQVDVLASKFKEIIAVAKQENFKLTATISDMTKKQAQFDEMLRIESDINSMHSEVAGFDSGILLTEKRLGLIQKSYDKLSQELLRRDELISQRDTKIAELESYIRESEILNRSVNDKSSLNSSREYTELDIAFSMDSPSKIIPPETSNDEKISRLIWLAAALRKKLKNKKEKEKLFKQEKQVMMNLANSLGSTWELLQNNWQTMQAENYNLKHQLAALVSKSQPKIPLDDSPPCTCLQNLAWNEDSRESIATVSIDEINSAHGRVPPYPNCLDDSSLFSQTSPLLTSSPKQAFGISDISPPQIMHHQHGHIVNPNPIPNQSTTAATNQPLNISQSFLKINEYQHQHSASSLGTSFENSSGDSTYDLSEVSQLMDECQRKIRVLLNP